MMRSNLNLPGVLMALLFFISGPVVAQPFTINQGLSGAWFEPETSGQGIYLEVYPPQNLVFLAWYTYLDVAADVELSGPGGQRWFTAQGQYSGDKSTLELSLSTGGAFDQPGSIDTQPVGNIELQFSSCTAATLHYELPEENLSGTLELVRLTPDSLCGNLSQVNR